MRILHFEHVARVDGKALRLRAGLSLTGMLPVLTRLTALTIS
jgi:hypothetical protein